MMESPGEPRLWLEVCRTEGCARKLLEEGSVMESSVLGGLFERVGHRLTGFARNHVFETIEPIGTRSPLPDDQAVVDAYNAALQGIVEAHLSRMPWAGPVHASLDPSSSQDSAAKTETVAADGTLSEGCSEA